MGPDQPKGGADVYREEALAESVLGGRSEALLVEPRAALGPEKMPGRHVVASVGGIPVGPTHVAPAPGPQDTGHLVEDRTGVTSVFEQVRTKDTVERLVGEWKSPGVALEESGKGWVVERQGLGVAVEADDGGASTPQRFDEPARPTPCIEQGGAGEAVPLLEVAGRLGGECAVERRRFFPLSTEEPPHRAQTSDPATVGVLDHCIAGGGDVACRCHSLAKCRLAQLRPRFRGGNVADAVPTAVTDPSMLSCIADADRAGIRRVQVVAYRDLDDPMAGGSELHLHEILSRWAGAGLAVDLRTVAGPGLVRSCERNGYHVERVGGYYTGIVRTALAGVGRRFHEADALVEVWNGMPVMSPLWWHRPRLTLLHHLHHELWHSTYPASVARFGSFIERRVAPRFYRTGPVATLSLSSAREIVADTALRAEQVEVVPPGIAESFGKGPAAREPIVLTVARLTSAKRIDAIVRSVAAIRDRVPRVRLVVVGAGPERDGLASLARELGIDDRVEFVGRIPDEELILQYQAARVLAAASSSEGWGMTITEAAACGTPAVASDIVGHRDAIGPDAGILANDDERFAEGLAHLLTDDEAWSLASAAALEASDRLSWDASAAALLGLLVSDARRRRS